MLRAIRTKPKRSRAPQWVRSNAATVTGRYVCIGSPGNDRFTRVIYHERLGNALRLKIEARDRDGLRDEVTRFLNTEVTGTGHSLDIIADAPDGVQRIDSALLMAIMNDDGSQLDEVLVGAIRSKFVQCRLLGCVTGADRVRKNARDLARLLKLPMVGTTRAIAYTDFDDDMFQDTYEGESIVRTITEDSAARSNDSVLISSRQQRWLEGEHFRQLRLADGEASFIGPFPSLTWQFPTELANVRFAASDVISTEPLAQVTLQTPSGARYPAEVLAAGTLLRLQSRAQGWVYLNVAPSNPERRNFLGALRQQQATTA